MTFMSRRRKTCEPSGHVAGSSKYPDEFSQSQISKRSNWSLIVSPTISPSSPFTTTFTHLTHTHYRDPHDPHYEYRHDNIPLPTHRHWQTLHTIPSMNQLAEEPTKFSWVRSDLRTTWIHHTPRIENTRHSKPIPSNLSHDIRRSTNMAEDTQPCWPIQGGGTTTSTRRTRSDRTDSPGTPGTRMAT